MALDELKENDVVVKNGEITFLVEENFEKNFPVVNIDYSNSWFSKGFSVVPGGYFENC